MCEGELRFDAILSDGVKKVSSGEGDTLRGEALQRNGSWGCSQVISCSHDSLGGERSWSCAAVNRWTTTIGPPHLGQRHSG